MTLKIAPTFIIQDVRWLSILQYVIPEAIPNQICYMNLGSTLNGYSDVGICNEACASRRG